MYVICQCKGKSIHTRMQTHRNTHILYSWYIISNCDSDRFIVGLGSEQMDIHCSYCRYGHVIAVLSRFIWAVCRNGEEIRLVTRKMQPLIALVQVLILMPSLLNGLGKFFFVLVGFFTFLFLLILRELFLFSSPYLFFSLSLSCFLFSLFFSLSL